MNWLMVAEGRARLGQKPIARKLHLSSPTPTPPYPPTTRNSPNFPEWPTSPFLTIQSCKKHFSCIRVRIKQKILCQSFSSLQISWSWLVLNYCGNLLAATFNQHCWPLDQPTNRPTIQFSITPTLSPRWLTWTTFLLHIICTHFVLRKNLSVMWIWIEHIQS